jgi:monofunctional biosynthetic peptidoglycan transglycosylase
LRAGPTQQLAKNLFLSRDKTVKRKVRELVLARRMEKTLTKDRILELYLNVVELGDMVYGVGAGARHHFGKQPSELSLRECSAHFWQPCCPARRFTIRTSTWIV